MDTINRTYSAEKADILAVRQELKLTVHEVALALAKRASGTGILADIAEDLRLEASALQGLAKGRPQARN